MSYITQSEDRPLSHIFFFFKKKTAYEMRISDWSSDVCSSDLRQQAVADELQQHGDAPADRPARLHGADGTAAVFGTDRLAHQHGAGGPFAAEAETQQDRKSVV